jgi:hypothetical protein
MPGFYIKQSEWEREQDSGETKRECVCVRDRVLQKARDGVVNKIDH